MEHVPPEDWPTVVTNLARALRAGGLLYLSLEVMADQQAELDRAYADAIAAYERANLAINGFSPLLIDWGDALLGLHQPEAALVKMRAAAALDPTFGATHAGVGRALVALGKPAEAEASFARACELDRHDPDALRAWAQTLDALGRQREAADKRARADVVEHENAQPLTLSHR